MTVRLILQSSDTSDVEGGAPVNHKAGWMSPNSAASRDC
jgi:hypothetical protein